jgi:hypothetical protein
VGTDSGKISSLLVCISIHPSVNYVSFDFLIEMCIVIKPTPIGGRG